MVTPPPHLHAVAPKIIALVTAKNQRQQAAAQHQHAERNQLGFKWRDMIERLGDVAFRIGPCPPHRVRDVRTTPIAAGPRLQESNS